MRKEFKIFATMVGLVFTLSLLYNLNKVFNYSIFDLSINEKLFGLSYTVPMVVCGYLICKNAKFVAEKIVCKLFLWISLSAFFDEIFFNPFKPQLHEHIVALIVLIAIIKINARRKENII
jgi:hypothetical protein